MFIHRLKTNFTPKIKRNELNTGKIYVVACDSLKIKDKICIHTSVEIIMYY